MLTLFQQIEDIPIKSKEAHATVTFKNPLPVSLKNGKFIIAGSSLLKTLEIKVGYVIWIIKFNV